MHSTLTRTIARAQKEGPGRARAIQVENMMEPDYGLATNPKIKQ